MKKRLKKTLPLLFVGLGFIILALYSQDRATDALKASGDYLMEMILIIPPVFLLMGLIEVWVPKNKIKEWIGNRSGIKGMAIAFLPGTLPTGPLYVAFPLAATMLRKGASVKNVVIFLGAWAALKIPQLMVEIEFLGASFALLRFALTAFVLVISAMIMDMYFKRYPIDFTREMIAEDSKPKE